MNKFISNNVLEVNEFVLYSFTAFKKGRLTVSFPFVRRVTAASGLKLIEPKLMSSGDGT